MSCKRIWIFIALVSNCRIINGLPPETPEHSLLPKLDPDPTQTSDFEENKSKTKNNVENISIVDQSVDNKEEGVHIEKKIEENNTGVDVKPNCTEFNINIELEATELLVPETKDESNALTIETQDKDVKHDIILTTPAPKNLLVTNLDTDFKSIKAISENKYKKGEILSKIEKALSLPKTKNAPLVKASSSDAAPVDMIPIFKPKSNVRNKSGKTNIKNRVLSSPYEALKIQSHKPKESEIENRLNENNKNTGNFVITGAVLKPLVNAEVTNVVNKPINAILSPTPLQPARITNPVTTNQVLPTNFSANQNALPNQVAQQPISNLNNCVFNNVVAQEPCLKIKNVVLHATSIKQESTPIKNVVSNVVPQTTTSNFRTNCINTENLKKDCNSIKILNVAPTLNDQKDFINLGCLAERSSQTQEIKTIKDDPVLVLMKPETVSLEKLYGNFLKKLTMTVLVPLHVSKLAS